MITMNPNVDNVWTPRSPLGGPSDQSIGQSLTRRARLDRLWSIVQRSSRSRTWRDDSRPVSRLRDFASLTGFRMKAVQAFFLKGSGGLVSFAVNVVLARLLGADGTGVYYLALSVITFVSVLSRFGLDPVVLRIAAGDWASNRQNRIRGLLQRALLVPALGSLLLLVTVMAVADAVATGVFGEPRLGTPLRVMVWAIFPFAGGALVGEALKAINKVNHGIALQNILTPLCTIFGALLLVPTFGVAGATLAFVASTIITLSVGAVLLARHTPGLHAPGLEETEGWELPAVPQLLSVARPFFAVTVTSALFILLGTALVGVWHDSREVGSFGVALRLAMLSTLIVTGINSFAAPAMARAYVKGHKAELAGLGRSSVSTALLLGVPVLAPMLLVPRQLMAIFGPEFAGDWPMLVFLAVGHMAYLAGGSSGYMLSMTAYETTERNLSVLALLVLTVGCVALIPPFGGVGAAAAMAVALTVRSGLTVLAVQRRLDIKLWTAQ
jgi:O-antigen/teichoic acid export membrane protein